MNDDPALTATWHRLTEARDSLGDEDLAIPASEIIARDKRRRTRHRLAAAGAACAAVGLAVGLALAPGSPARPEPRHTRLAAWTVHTNPDGTVTFTLQSTSHPAQLQRALANAGIPAVVSWGKICQAYGPGHYFPIDDLSSFIEAGSGMDAPGGIGPFFAVNGGQRKNLALGWSWIITPSKIPHGGHFLISAVPGHIPEVDYQAVWQFARTSAPIACARLTDN
jgi:hypothetical protein